MFGEIVGAWLIEAWRLSGSPSPVRLVELGPGRGTLMADILRVAAKVPDFSRCDHVHLVETSPALKARQAETLAGAGREISWHASFGDVPTARSSSSPTSSSMRCRSGSSFAAKARGANASSGSMQTESSRSASVQARPASTVS